jgi:hypothetical protein
MTRLLSGHCIAGSREQSRHIMLISTNLFKGFSIILLHLSCVTYYLHSLLSEWVNYCDPSAAHKAW